MVSLKDVISSGFLLDDELEAGALRLVPLPLAGAALGLVLDLVLPMSVLYLSARYFSVFFSVAVTLPPSFDEASSFLTSAALSLPVDRLRGRGRVGLRCLRNLGGPLGEVGHPVHP